MANNNIPESINYNRVNWEDNYTPLDADNLNVMDKGIKEIIDAYNALPAWVKSYYKPTYTSAEIGADPAGKSEQDVALHDADVLAHKNVLAQKIHTHDITTLEGYDTLEANDSKSLGGKSPAFYLNYNNFTNTPQEKTKLSEFDNDKGYITYSDVNFQLKGTYVGGYITEKKIISTPFVPKEVVVFEKNSYTSQTENKWDFFGTYKTGEIEVEFGTDYFSLLSTPDGEMNKSNCTYVWFALSIAIDKIAVGPTGATGLQGPTGRIGLMGPTGEIGPTGEVGPTGAEGLVGPTGTQGPVGPTGEVGPTGPQGLLGPTGPAPSTSQFEQIANKVTQISANSTDTEYSSAKAVYEYVEARINDIFTELANSQYGYNS